MGPAFSGNHTPPPVPAARGANLPGPACAQRLRSEEDPSGDHGWRSPEQTAACPARALLREQEPVAGVLEQTEGQSWV